MFLLVKRGKTMSRYFAMTASRPSCQGCIGYWCHTIDTKGNEEKVEDISMVCEFRDVFPELLP